MFGSGVRGVAILTSYVLSFAAATQQICGSFEYPDCDGLGFLGAVPALEAPAYWNPYDIKLSLQQNNINKVLIINIMIFVKFYIPAGCWPIL